MDGSAIHAAELVFLLLLLFVVVFGILAQKLQVPFAIVLVVGGLLLGFVPGLPRFSLNPDVVFFVFLPPLLYAGAWVTSWRDFRYHLVSISFLAVGLVAFTVFAVAELAPRLLGWDWRSGFVLGAVVATTDAIAATSIARRLALPRRIVDLLEGESLVNDATGLLALRFGTDIMAGRSVSVLPGIGTLGFLIAVGIAVGLAIAWIVERIERRLDDAAIEIAVSILVPYVAYLAAEALHASGVLAVVACGLYLSRKSVTFFTPTVRIQIWAVWNALTFILNGFVFVLIGLQLPAVLAGIPDVPLSRLLGEAALFCALIIGVRLVWIYPGAAISFAIRRYLLHQPERFPPARQIFVVGWTGMRGVIALAAALAVPATLADGRPFPERNMIVFLTFSVILVTLVVQGLTLPSVIRALGLAGMSGPGCEEIEARRLIAQAGLDHLVGARGNDRPEFAPVYEDAIEHYRERLADAAAPGDGAGAEKLSRARELMRETLRAERDTAIALRDEGRINDDILRTLERDIDLREAQLETEHQT